MVPEPYLHSRDMTERPSILANWISTPFWNPAIENRCSGNSRACRLSPICLIAFASMCAAALQFALGHEEELRAEFWGPTPTRIVCKSSFSDRHQPAGKELASLPIAM